MKAIVVQHNLFINRDNPKELNKTVREVMITELSEIYAIVTSKEQTKSERIKE